MKIGAERKKLTWLGGLVLVAGLVYWMNSGSDAPPSPAGGARPALDPAAAAATAAAGSKTAQRRVAQGRVQIKPFEPGVPVDPVDPAKIDPTLRLDLLAKVQAVQVDAGTHRNVFKIEQPPPEPVQVAKNGDADILHKSGKIDLHGPDHATGTSSTPPPPPVRPGPPPAPSIALKYYGYSTNHMDGEKKAFFLDGEEVIVAAEGEIIKKQYKVVRIGVNSVQMEDTTSKSTQTLPLQENAPAA